MTVYLTLEDLLSLVADLNVGPVGDLGRLDSAAHHALLDGNKRAEVLTTGRHAASGASLTPPSGAHR